MTMGRGAQNCSICAKEEPQAQTAYKANSFALLQHAPAALVAIYPPTNAQKRPAEKVFSAGRAGFTRLFFGHKKGADTVPFKRSADLFGNGKARLSQRALDPFLLLPYGYGVTC